MRNFIAILLLFLLCVGLSYIGKYIDHQKIKNYHTVIAACPACDQHIADSLAKQVSFHQDIDAENAYYELRQQCAVCERDTLSLTWGPVPDTVWWKRKPSFNEKW